MNKSTMLLCIFTIFIHVNVGKAQGRVSNYYFVVGKDTTFCRELYYGTTAQGYLDKIEYVDMQDKKVKLKGRKNVPDVITFQLDNLTYDKVPLRADKPDSYIRYTQRVVDGGNSTLKSNPMQMTSGGYSVPGGVSMVPSSNSMTSTGHSGLYRFYLKMPDGT